MASTKKLGNTQGIDRISSLPEEILGQILSSLPTKYAVATSVLSTRWRNLFTLLTNFDFDDYLIFNQQKQHDFSSFKSFVERVLRLCRSPNKHRFSLKCYAIDHRTLMNDETIYKIADINAFLSSAVAHNLKEIDILIAAAKWCDLPPHMLDPCLFNCVALKVLKLNGYLCLDVPMSFCLPSLKVVHLDSVEFPDSASVTRFFSNCLALEEFSSEENEWDDVEVVNISSPTLERLMLNLKKGAVFQRDAVVLDCPNLVYLSYIDVLALHYSMGSLHALGEALIDVLDDDFPILQSSLDSLLSSLSNVTRLSVHDPRMKRYTLPVFHNLKVLSISYCLGGEILWEKEYSKLLEASPVLETLIFTVGLGSGELYREDSMGLLRLRTALQNHVVPSCVSNTLKTIEVHNFMGFKKEFEITKFFLRTAQVLEELKLYSMYPRIPAEKEELLHFPMCSKKCSITFVSKY